jgi:hypothetical protein
MPMRIGVCSFRLVVMVGSTPLFKSDGVMQLIEAAVKLFDVRFKVMQYVHAQLQNANALRQFLVRIRRSADFAYLERVGDLESGEISPVIDEHLPAGQACAGEL